MKNRDITFGLTLSDPRKISLFEVILDVPFEDIFESDTPKLNIGTGVICVNLYTNCLLSAIFSFIN